MLFIYSLLFIINILSYLQFNTTDKEVILTTVWNKSRGILYWASFKQGRIWVWGGGGTPRTYFVATWPIQVQGFSNQACSSLQHNAGSHIFGMSNTHDQSFLFGVTKDS